MPKSKHLNYHTELSENSDKWLSMLLLNLLPFICTIMKDYSDKLKSGLIECTKNLVQSLTSKWISVVWTMNAASFTGKTKCTGRGSIRLFSNPLATILPSAPPIYYIHVKKRNSRLTIASNLWKFQPNRSKEVAKDINGLSISWRKTEITKNFSLIQNCYTYCVPSLSRAGFNRYGMKIEKYSR